jgi:hypothetical protein
MYYILILGDKSIFLYDLVKMGDPVKVVDNLTHKSILSICFDNSDTYLTVSTEDYKIQFYELKNILNKDLSLRISTDDRVELSLQYMTKKTPIMVMKYTSTNVLLCLGRFDDNDPKIFM